jgi:4-amino-4-deoxy-L-arabinose transferase-like glycosyltransferase
MNANPGDAASLTVLSAGRWVGGGWPAALPLAVGLWLAATVAALALRPLLPIDETRYLAVGWEMWSGGDWLVPHLNGAFYGHKPPLLFWLFELGWALFGVSETWARLMGPLAGLGGLLLTRAPGRALWPQQPGIADAAMLALLAIAVWPLFSGMVMFDTWLTVGVLMALLGAVRVAEGRRFSGWGLFAAGFVVGFFAKGPAVLPFLVPVPLLGPLWSGEGRSAERTWWHWWLGGTLAGIIGVAVIALWAVPVVLSEGLDYVLAVVRDQATDRMSEAADHGRAWWWYAVVVLPLLLPLVAWLAPWRGRWTTDAGTRFCLIWAGGSLLLLSIVGGKQVHYLLPALPAVALLAARRLAAGASATPRRADLAIPALLAVAVGVVTVLLPRLPLGAERAAAVASLATGWGWALIAAGLLAATTGWRPAATDVRRQLAALAALATALVVVVHLVAAPLLAARFDVHPFAERLAAWEREGRPIANYATYHGQFHFAGRLRHPIAEIGDAQAAAWMAAHPDGIVISYQDRLPEGAAPLFSAPYRGGLATAWDVAAVQADPAIVRRDQENAGGFP